MSLDMNMLQRAIRDNDARNKPPKPQVIKVYEPVKQTPDDTHMVSTMGAVQDYLSITPATPEQHKAAYSPDSDEYHVQTGTATVTQLENLRDMFSTAPVAAPKDSSQLDLVLVLAIIGIGLIIFKKGQK